MSPKPALLILTMIVAALAIAVPTAQAAPHRCSGAVEVSGTEHGLRAYAIRVDGIKCTTGKAVVRRFFNKMFRDIECAADSIYNDGCEVGDWICERRRGARPLCYHARFEREVTFREYDW
jgi:hypothetical protein